MRYSFAFRLVIILLFGATSGSFSQEHIQRISAQLQEGDIIFQKIPCGDLCDAIIETTPCQPGRMFNHCGIVHISDRKVYVIEAIGKAVKQTSLPDFLRRDTSSPIIYAGRIKEKHTVSIPSATGKAQKYIGTPYDDSFLPGDNALYCSELVWECYRDASNAPLFSLQPMTFKSPSTGITYPAWAAYYKDLKRSIPEGVPGINPCAIANSGRINLMALRR